MESPDATPPIDLEELALHPVATTEVLAPPSPLPIETSFDVERVDRIERALEQSRYDLEQSRFDLAALTSQVATLVGAVADMNNRLSQPAPIETSFDVERVGRIERALEQSRHDLEHSRLDIAASTSQVAALVGAVADMNNRLSQPAPVVTLSQPAVTQPQPVVTQPHTVVPRRRLMTLPAIASVVIGLSLGVAAWRYLSSASTMTLPGEQYAAVPVPPAEAVAQPAIAPMPTTTPPVNAAQDVSDTVTPVIKPAADAPIRYVGTLSIDSSPGGQVFVDRKMVGRTPMRVQSLRAGSHLIWIEREGYRRWTRVVQVPADRVSRVSVELEPMATR